MKKLYTRGVLLLMFSLFINVTISFAQTLDEPDPQFTAPCASSTFNTYDVDFHWEPPLVASDNEFILELSDGGGDFTNAVELDRVADSNTNFDIVFNFAFPTDTAGENYRVRVRSTNPAIISPESVIFPAYYVNVDETLILNNFEDVILCGGSEALISVTNFPDEQLYNWYKDNVLIASEKGPSLSVSEVGLYYVEVDYGNFCSGDTASNIVEAIDGAAGSNEVVTITSDGTGNCETQEDVTITSSLTDSNYTYAWFRNDIEISETSPVLVTNEPGTYLLEVTIGQCPIYSNEIVIQGLSAGTVTINPAGEIFLQGESRSVTAEGADTYEWIDPLGTTISTTDTAEVVSPGIHTLRASSNGCEVEIQFTVISLDITAIPNVLTPNGDGVNDQWAIPSTYAFNPEVEVIIYGSTGKILHQTFGYENNWPETTLTHIKNNPLFYYRILTGNEVLEQGSITLIK